MSLLGAIAAHYVDEVAAGAYFDEVMADNPLAYYRLGESSGTTMLDSSGNGRSGTYSGPPTLDTPSLVPVETDAAAAFNGVNQWGAVPYAAWLNTGPTVTVEAVIKPNALGGGGGATDGTIAARWASSGTRPFFLSLQSNGTLRFVSSSANSDVIGSTVLTVGQTYHVTAVAAPGAAWLYVNGVEDGTDGFTLAQSTTLGLNVGRMFSSAFYFDGTLDEVAIYSTALSPERIAAHYAATGLGA